jgi:hypothetical protein
MPIFLTAEQIYRIIQRELPDQFVYPDGQPSAFFSTADSYATAKVVADAYSNLSEIYDNYFPNHATVKQPDFELLHLGKSLSDTISLQGRRDRVISKIRSRRRTTPDDIKATVYTVIDPSIMVEIVEWGCEDGGWVLDESQLDISTILRGFNNLNRVGPDLCILDAADFGLSEEDLLLYREEAYMYEIRIYSHTLTEQERDDMETAVLAAEPARSRHIILDGLDPDDSIGGDT